MIIWKRGEVIGADWWLTAMREWMGLKVSLITLDNLMILAFLFHDNPRQRTKLGEKLAAWLSELEVLKWS